MRPRQSHRTWKAGFHGKAGHDRPRDPHTPLSHTRSHAVFNAEAQYLAPGTQSVALFSQLCIDHGEGACLYDVDGNRYIDLLAGVGVAALGHAHPRWVAAMQKQLSRVHVGSFTTEHRAALVETLARVTPGDLSRTQFYSVAPRPSRRRSGWPRPTRSAPRSSASGAAFMARPVECCRS